MLLILTYFQYGDSQAPDGWKMHDRFVGFRYLISLEHNIDISEAYDTMKGIRYRADKSFCFGWAQHAVVTKQIVGEFRCYKHRVMSVVNYLRENFSTQLKLDKYPDSRIKLHYSKFRILDSDVTTCFRDEPHKCAWFIE